jgi:CHAT domain-containing protein/predicted negative regulator of RcsB-dependent stress response
MLFRNVASSSLTLLVIPLLSGFMLEHGPVLASVRGAGSSTSQRAGEDRSAAKRVSAEAEQLVKEQRVESSRRAIEKYKESLQLWRAAADHRQEAITLKRIGDVYQPLGEYQNALTFYRQALSLNHGASDLQAEGETLNEIAYVLLNLGENQQALTLTHRSIRLSEMTGNQRGIARAQNNFGEIYYGLGDLQQSLKYCEKALELWRKQADPSGQALALLNSGYVYSDLGLIKEAFDSYKQAITLWESSQDRRGEAITLTAIGRLYSRIGETQEALDFFQRGQQLIQPIGDRNAEVSGLNGMANIYNVLGESQRALEYYNRSLGLVRTGQYRGLEATTLGDVGRVYFSLGENAKALDHHQLALSIFRAIGDRRMEIVELKEIAKIYDSQGDQRKAFNYYQRARSSYHNENDLRGESVTLNLIGRIYVARGQKQEALECFGKALRLGQKAEYPEAQAAALNNLARLERDSGDLVAALERSKQAMVVIESLREKVNSPDLRTSYFASVRQQHEFYIDLLMRLHQLKPDAGYNRAALEATERSRARSLLEGLIAARVGVRDNADPELLERERKLNQQFHEAANRRPKTDSEEAMTPEAKALAEEIDDLVWQLRDVQAQIRTSSIRHLMAKSTEPFTLKHFQEQVLDDNSMLLEFMLGEERSYVWAVTRTDVWSYELPPRGQIETGARKLTALLAANQPVPNETFAQHQARIADAAVQFPDAAASLGDLLLGPLQPKLGAKRLLIVPDGALQSIPFAALTVPPSVGKSDPQDRMPLVLDHEIVYEPSASVLTLMRKDRNEADDRKTIAVFANPVFEADDPRVTRRGESTTSTDTGETRRLFRDLGFTDGRVPALPSSRDEAEAIMSFAPPGTGLKALGFDASRATVIQPELAQYRIVHFATHGFVDYERPELSGLVLSLVDKDGQPEDGYLRLQDIYNLRLSADLVVLSACNTGLGKEVRGEGLIGLTRGFMYAGASSVTASLWKVDDEATAELMKLFYEGMFKQGLTPAAALRQAQLEMRHSKRWHEPYYWAAFIIQGQYDQKEVIPSKFPLSRVLIAAATSLVLLVAFLLLIKTHRKIPSSVTMTRR